MYRLVTNQIAKAALTLAVARKVSNVLEKDIADLPNVGFLGLNNKLMRSLPKHYLNFFNNPVSAIVLKDSELIEALREDGIFIEMLLIWLGANEQTATDTRGEILQTKNVRSVTIFRTLTGNNAYDAIVDFSSASEIDGEIITDSINVSMPNALGDNKIENDEAYNFLLDNPFVIFSAILKAACAKTRIHIKLPSMLKGRFMQWSFNRMFFWMFNAAARLNQNLSADELPENLGTFNAACLDFHISDALARVILANEKGLTMSFGDDEAICSTVSRRHLYSIKQGVYLLSHWSMACIIDGVPAIGRKMYFEEHPFVVLANQKDAQAFDIALQSTIPGVVAAGYCEKTYTGALGYPAVVMKSVTFEASKDKKKLNSIVEFFDVQCGVKVGSASFPKSFHKKVHGESSTTVMIEPQEWWAYPSVFFTVDSLVTLKRAILRNRQENTKEIIFEKNDRSAFALSDEFIAQIAGVLTKQREHTDWSQAVKAAVRSMSGLPLKTVKLNLATGDFEVTFA